MRFKEGIVSSVNRRNRMNAIDGVRNSTRRARVQSLRGIPCPSVVKIVSTAATDDDAMIEDVQDSGETVNFLWEPSLKSTTHSARPLFYKSVSKKLCSALRGPSLRSTKLSNRYFSTPTDAHCNWNRGPRNISMEQRRDELASVNFQWHKNHPKTQSYQFGPSRRDKERNCAHSSPASFL
jgi:hypothetical protein